MADLNEVYDAMRRLGAQGDMEGVRKLADYIDSQNRARKPQSMDVLADGTLAPTGSPQAKAAISPVAGNNGLQNALAGAGSSVMDAYLATKQMLGLSNGQEAADKRALDAPLDATTGGKVGKVLGTIGMGVPLSMVPGAGTYAGAAALGGLFGALNPVTDGESRLANTAVGAGLGVAGKYGTDKLGAWLSARRAMPPTDTGLTATQAERAATGQQLGFSLPPGQRTGNATLQKLDARLESVPFTSAPFDALKRQNQQNLNRIASEAVGNGGAPIDAAGLGQTVDRLGEVFNKAGDPAKIVPVDPNATKGVIDTIEQSIEGMLPNNAKLRDNGLVKSIETTLSQGQATADQLRQFSSKLGKVAYKQMGSPNGDRDLGDALYALKDHVDELLGSSMSGPDLAEYNAARQQYRTLMQLTSRIGTVNPSTGDVSGANLANVLQTKDRPGFLYGNNQSDLYNAARFAQSFKPAVGNSGTATRSSGAIKDFLLGVPGNLASSLYMTKPGTAVAEALVTGPKALGRGVVALGDQSLPIVVHSMPGLSGLGAGNAVPYLMQ